MSMLARLATTGGAPVYVDDVFSTWLYNGNGSTQTITNGIDLAGKGGLVWLKCRSGSTNHAAYDTARGAAQILYPNLTNAQTNTSPAFSSFNSNGFSLNGADHNTNGDIYTSWTFRKQPKFFDVVTYTGTGSAQNISHSLSAVPGCMIVKRTDTTGDWQVYHRSLSPAARSWLVLNTTAAGSTDTGSRWNDTSPTTTQFTVGTSVTTNASGGTYVAYLFAHDAGGFGLSDSDSAIFCGTFSTDAAGVATVTLGWEPQWLLIKTYNTTGDWSVVDNMRGSTVGGADAVLRPNLGDAESLAVDVGNLTATGFVTNNLAASQPFIYIAIRRPNKPPTTGTQVFTPTVYTGTNVDSRLVNTTIAPDMVWVRQRDSTTVAGMVVGDRLRGQRYLLTGSTAGEVNDADSFDQQNVSAVKYGTAFSSMNGFWCGNDATSQLNASTTANNQIAEAFKRAPGFLDVVCYTGTGANLTLAHNLAVKPELALFKRRSGVDSWVEFHDMNASTYSYTFFGLEAATTEPYGAGYRLQAQPTSTSLYLNDYGAVNTLSATYVAYLFASLPGISKVGSYTGNGGTFGTNGTSQTINCGFGTGARFVLIKRTDITESTGAWYVFDSARGIVAGSDPYIVLNIAGGENPTKDVVDADNSGFIVNQTSGTDLNVTGATYIYLAIA